MSSHLDETLLTELREIMEEGFDELLAVFLRESADQYRQLCSAWESGERGSLRRLAHALKGCCSNLGARNCADLAAALEKAAIGEQWQDVPVLMRDLDRELSATHQEIGGLSAPG